MPGGLALAMGPLSLTRQGGVASVGHRADLSQLGRGTRWPAVLSREEAAGRPDGGVTQEAGGTRRGRHPSSPKHFGAPLPSPHDPTAQSSSRASGQVKRPMQSPEEAHTQGSWWDAWWGEVPTQKRKRRCQPPQGEEQCSIGPRWAGPQVRRAWGQAVLRGAAGGGGAGSTRQEGVGRAQAGS